MQTMLDTTTPGEIPAVLSPRIALAGYVGGSWPTYAALKAAHPHNHVLSIAVNAGERARCLDVENGDATPYQVPEWLGTGYDPSEGPAVLYASASVVAQIISLAANAGYDRHSYLVWSAHYFNHPGRVCGPGVCEYPQANGTQEDDRWGGRNVDSSILYDGWFGAPLRVDLRDYDSYPNIGVPWTEPGVLHHHPRRVVAVHERATVIEYDRLRPHPVRNWRRLHELRTGPLTFLRNRAKYEALGPPNRGWNDARLGWRWQQLNRRVNGEVIR